MIQPKGLPWQYVGTKNVSECTTSKEVMETAKLDWEVGKAELFAKIPMDCEVGSDSYLDKINEAALNVQIDESRLAMEVTVYADKICVDEEIVRLKSHIGAVKDTLNNGGAVGRRLDFLAQELNREANTILSKSTDVSTSDAAIEIKTGIEKIREQVQNIE